eukprot:GDKH01026955.1.p1 GENE.GDKH01026955.1~~GDKH01026955.1.p1  ORF type:complete len:74 (-),score=3.14 GDKH01026955.1:40-261(-)
MTEGQVPGQCLCDARIDGLTGAASVTFSTYACRYRSLAGCRLRASVIGLFAHRMRSWLYVYIGMLKTFSYANP